MKLARWLGGVLAALLLAVAGLYLFAQSDAGRRFVVDRIAALQPANGLRIRIGRIDGSIFGKATLHQVQLLDGKGVFFEAPDIALDWTPLAWTAQRLDINSVTAPTASFIRLPQFVATGKGPILPNFDIRIGELAIGRLVLGKAIAGTERIARVDARADIHRGRALIDFDAGVIGGGDRIVLKLDSEPDRNKFDLNANVSAPVGGVVATLGGLQAPLSATIAGNGSWQEWRGTLKAQLGSAPIADLRLSARNGRYDVAGTAAPARLIDGKVARVLGPVMQVRGNAALADRRLDTHLMLDAPALATAINGVVDLGESRFVGVHIDLRLRQPQALLPSMTGHNVRAQVMLDGSFAAPAFDYLLTGDSVAIDTTGFEAFRMSGRGRWTPWPVMVPINLTARRVTGIGSVAGGILANLSVDGVLRVTPRVITGDGLRVRSDKLNGRISIAYDLATGQYNAGVAGKLNRFLIDGLGIVDVSTDLRLTPDGRVAGTGEVWVRRLDNAFLASLTGGLPHIVARLDRDMAGQIRFTNLVLTSRDLILRGQGVRRIDGTFHFEGTGTQRRYGPVRLVLDGPIERPRVDLQLTRPLDSAKLRDVVAQLRPTAAGFDFTVRGGSMLGPFSGTGAILLPKNGAAVVRIARLEASGLVAKGDLRAAGGAIDGLLTLTGSGIAGTLRLSPQRGIQRVDARINAVNARLAGPPLIAARRARIDAVVLLDPRGTSVDGTIDGEGLRYGSVALSRLAVAAHLVDGQGTVRGTAAGTRGRGFDVTGVAQVARNRIVFTGGGTVDRQSLVLSGPVVLTRDGAGWALSPVSVQFAGGTARLSGRFGGAATAINTTITHMPLSVLDIVNPSLGLGGLASGTVTYAQASGAATPTARADLRVRNLTRAGLLPTSQPIDVGVIAVLDGRGGAMRAIAALGGKTIGQAQARIAPLAPGGSIIERLQASPLFAQLRYNGSADSLWRLTGVQGIDVSGPVAIGADVTGRLSNPTIRGSVRTAGLRLEGATSGTVLTNVRGDGSFDGSRLVIPAFTGNAGKGTVSGRATFDLAAARGFRMDIAIDAKNAELIKRDDFGATVTGPLTISSEGGAGRIAGKLYLDRSSFRLGQASAAAAVPKLNVREINGRQAKVEDAPSPPTTWALDVDARADNRLAVTGLGMDSEWSTDLHIGGTLGDMAITGRADVVRGGYEFAGKRFELTRGVIRFTGGSINPVVDVVAESQNTDLAVTVRVTGTAQNPEIAFTSTPALPQEELLSRLLFGNSITTLSAPEALQLAAAVTSLRGGKGGLNPLNALRQAIGLDRLRVIAADATVGNKTALAAGKYITRRTFVEIISDGQGYSATRLEFQITRWLSLLTTVSTIGRTSATARVSKDY